MPPPTNTADVGAAFSWSFAKFQQYAGTLIGLSAVIAAVSVIGGLLSNALIDDGLEVDSTTGALESSGGIWVGLIISVIVAIAVAILRIGILRAALHTSRGQAPSFSDLTSTENLVPYILTALVVGILTAVGLVLCILPGLAVMFFMIFAATHSLDKGASVGDALSWSFNAVKANVVPCLLLVLIVMVASVISALAGGIGGTLVAALIGLVIDPFAALVNANLYRQVGHEPVAA